MKKDFFNIYYINISKVYELAMINDNRISSSVEKESIQGKEDNKSRKSRINANYEGILGADISEGNSIRKYQSSKIRETIEIKTTKSLLLRGILDKCKCLAKDSTSIDNGDLLYIDNIKLDLDNEEQIRTYKMIRNDAIKGMKYEGVDLNNLVNSLLKDYSYILTGESSSLKDKLLIKIPMTNGEDFENMYTIDDLTIGSVTLIGIYRGKIHKRQLKNTLSSLEDLSDSEINDFDFESSDDTRKHSTAVSGTGDDVEYDFIDVIAIIQNVNTSISAENDTNLKQKWYKKIWNKIRGVNND
jgi:hypothetical protein